MTQINKIKNETGDNTTCIRDSREQLQATNLENLEKLDKLLEHINHQD